MINAVIIEDEIFSMQKLGSILNKVAPDVDIIAIISSVKEGIDYFKNSPPADLIFSDVQLSDGLSFEIFKEVKITTPVIFITGFEEFIIYAFENNGIDYLIKPVSGEDVSKALIKYKRLENHFSIQNKSFYKLVESFGTKKKCRLMVRKGNESISLKYEDIVLFYTESRIVYVFDKTGKKFLTDKTMYELETELDDSIFFRANRQYVVNLNFIKSFKTYEKVKIKVELNISEINHDIIISQRTAPDFRTWISQL